MSEGVTSWNAKVALSPDATLTIPRQDPKLKVGNKLSCITGAPHFSGIGVWRPRDCVYIGPWIFLRQSPDEAGARPVSLSVLVHTDVLLGCSLMKCKVKVKPLRPQKSSCPTRVHNNTITISQTQISQLISLSQVKLLEPDLP